MFAQCLAWPMLEWHIYFTFPVCSGMPECAGIAVSLPVPSLPAAGSGVAALALGARRSRQGLPREGRWKRLVPREKPSGPAALWKHRSEQVLSPIGTPAARPTRVSRAVAVAAAAPQAARSFLAALLLLPVPWIPFVEATAVRSWSWLLREHCSSPPVSHQRSAAFQAARCIYGV